MPCLRGSKDEIVLHRLSMIPRTAFSGRDFRNIVRPVLTPTKKTRSKDEKLFADYMGVPLKNLSETAAARKLVAARHVEETEQH